MKVKPPPSIHPVRFGPGLVTGPIVVDDATGEHLKSRGWSEVDEPKKTPARKRPKHEGEGR